MIAALLALAAAAPALWISFPSRAGGPCKPEQFVNALAELRPSLEVRIGDQAAPGDATATLAIDSQEGKNDWTLEVLLAGKPPLHRALPPPGADCVETAGTAALMIDRALDDLHWSGDPVRIDSLGEKKPLGEQKSDDEKVDAANIGMPNIGTPTNSPELPSAPINLALELGLGVAAVFGSIEPGLSLELSGRRGPWSLGVTADAALPFAAPVGGDSTVGTFSGFEGAAQARLGRAFALGPGTLRGEAGFGLELADASASGPLLFRQTSESALGAFLSARAGYEIPLPARFALAARLEGRLFIRPITFAVDGYPGGLSSGRAAATLSICVSRNFF